jgi:hypothetical protein
MRCVSAVVVLCALVVPSESLFAQDKRGPSTPQERTQALAYIHAFQADPLGPNAKDESAWLLQWVADVPDLTVHVCMILDKLAKPEKKDSATIFFGQVAAQTEFVVTHPEQKDDRDAEMLAGVQGALHVYELVLKSNPKDRQPYLDDLIQRRGAGTLGQYVKDRATAACK